MLSACVKLEYYKTGREQVKSDTEGDQVSTGPVPPFRRVAGFKRGRTEYHGLNRAEYHEQKHLVCDEVSQGCEGEGQLNN